MTMHTSPTWIHNNFREQTAHIKFADRKCTLQEGNHSQHYWLDSKDGQVCFKWRHWPAFINYFLNSFFAHDCDSSLHNIPNVQPEWATRALNCWRKPVKWAKWSMWPTTAQTVKGGRGAKTHHPTGLHECQRVPRLPHWCTPTTLNYAKNKICAFRNPWHY